jgi:hypothetical protein
MRRFHRDHIIGVFGHMRCDDVAITVEKVHAILSHLHSLAPLMGGYKGRCVSHSFEEAFCLDDPRRAARKPNISPARRMVAKIRCNDRNGSRASDLRTADEWQFMMPLPKAHTRREGIGHRCIHFCGVIP